MTIAFIYKWTHIPTLKWYIGSRTAKGCHLEDGYICSSKIVKPLIKANPNDWERTIITTGLPEDMLKMEYDILYTMDAAKDSRSFNKSIGIPTNLSGIPKSIEHKENIRISLLGKKRSLAVSEACKEGHKKRTYVGGWKWSDESILKAQNRIQTKCSCINCMKEVTIQTLFRHHLSCELSVTERPDFINP